MKRIISLLLVMVLLVGVIGCNGKPQNMSDATYNIGIEALEIIDKYLDGGISARSAYDSLEELRDRLDEHKPNSDGSSSEAVNHTLVNGSVLRIWMGLGDIARDSATSDSIIEERNNLAEKLNQKER